MPTENGQTEQTSDLSNFDRDVALYERMIQDLTRAVGSGDSFSADDRKEFLDAWGVHCRAVARGDMRRQLEAEERLDRLANIGRRIKDHRAQLLKWIEQRRRLIETKLLSEAAAKKASAGGVWDSDLE